jgi:hypothetical protein
MSVSSLAYASTLKIEVICCSETSVVLTGLREFIFQETESFIPIHHPMSLNYDQLLKEKERGGGTQWRSWLRHYATNWKVAGSNPG